MGKITDIIRISLDIQDQIISYATFGTPMIIERFAVDDSDVLVNGITFPARTMLFSDIDAVGLTFKPESKIYQALETAFGQDRKPASIVVGRADTLDADMGNSIDACRKEYDKFYGLTLISRSKTDIISAAKYIEDCRKIFIAQSSDSDILVAGTTDIAYQLKQDNYKRTALIYHNNDTDYIDTAILSYCLTFDPGTVTFARKELTGVSECPLDPNTAQIVLGKNCNFYDDIADSGDFREGTMAGGRFIDIMITADYIQSTLEQRIYLLLKQNPKVAYTDKGAGKIQATVDKFLSECETAELIADDPKYVVTIPRVVDIPQADRAARKLTQLKFRARLAGAIHTTYIEGTLTI